MASNAAILRVPQSDVERGTACDVLAGAATIGYGCDIFGEYCAPSSLSHRLFRTDDYSKRDPVSGKLVSPLVDVASASLGMATRISGSTLESFSSKFAASVDLKGNYSFFAGELHASYDTERRSVSTTSFVQYNQTAYYHRLSLPTFTKLRDFLTEEAAANFAGAMTPDELVETYGTHYISALIVGGRCSYCCTVDTTRYTTSVDIATAAEASFHFLSGSAEGKATAEEKEAGESLRQASTAVARVLGGDPATASGILDGDLKSWLASVPDFKQVCDLKGGLVDISRLVADEQRRKAVKDAVDNALNAHPGAPNTVPVYAFSRWAKINGAENVSQWFYCLDGVPPDSTWRPNPNIYFKAFKEAQEGTHPVYRLKTKAPGAFMLSFDASDHAGWAGAELVFHAYRVNHPGKRLTQVHSYFSKKDSALSGWHYTRATEVKGWSLDDRNSFFVPVA